MARVLDDSAARKLGPGTTLQHVLRLAQQLNNTDTPFDMKTYEHLLSAYSKAGKCDKIKLLLKQMKAKDIKPARIFFDKALQLAARFGNSTLQAELLLHMEYYGYPKTSKTYHYMLTCMRENMELERALDTIEHMKKQEIEPSTLSYIGIIHLAVLLQQPRTAYELLCSAKQLSDFPWHDEFLFLQVLRSSAYHNEYDIVKTIWEEAVIHKKFKPDEGVCLHVLNTAGKNADPQLSSSVIEYIGRQGYPYRECHFQLLLETFALSGNIIGTFELFNVMRAVGIIPNKKTVAPIVSIFVHDKNAIEKAKDALHHIASANSEKLDIAAFNLVIHVLASSGKNEEAISLLNQIDEFGLKPNNETLDAALDACIHSKDVTLGEEIYKDMISKGVKKTVSTLNKMVVLMCTQDDYEDAFKYLEEMKHLSMVPYRGSYYKLVKKLAASNDSRLNIALDDMKDYGYKLSTHLEQYIQKAEELEIERKEGLLSSSSW
ncbi:hypothetical protein G6F57_012540 [Rhizopus arrhizus]|uniref:Pentatricopeptide repeat-containing protein-mitochondrial domain-containing protein n=1 Tax=Rhizopus oryzae TaxID=64495 RepID=A0A9P6WYQ3_RHIOR|nr:hypothetical protein G6F23_010632 [Rhizopus arrhizus]KAG1398063.1 hypothetical protein G6F58_011401 [Rhizopus delemar]KAG0779920.1 hypothetical protein G6F22_010363 [Rhizopus arrhizus]KAG0781216.1 hypothetical protein G6F21_011760 [Rhizopus arrhizus]KAG0805152.1 hypothetical protein G6F20_012137 [Rhizopus arrhizus]